MKVLVLYSLSPEKCEGERWLEEFDLTDSVEAVAQALPGSVVAGVPGKVEEIIAVVRKHSPDAIFNLCEAPLGRPDREHHAAALFEWMGVPFTGSGSETLALCRHKGRTSAVLSAAGIPVAREGIFPCVVKPIDEDGSFGINNDSLCYSAEDVARARAHFPGDARVEEFLPGREFAVSLWGQEGPDCAFASETVFAGGMRLNTYLAKWWTESEDYKNTPMRYDTEISPGLRNAVLDAARGAWRATGARGYLRVDLRQNSEGIPCVLDVNPNPALAPGIGVGRAAAEAGLTFERLVQKLVEWAC